MDRDRFDTLTRALGAEGTRRSALGVLLGTALFGAGLDVEAKKNRNKRQRRRRRRRRNQPTTCFGTLICEFPSDGLDFENCDLSGTDIETCDGCNFRRADLGDTDLSEGSFQGVSFRAANLRGADLTDADVSGSSFRDACLVNADFTGANTDGAHFGDAILCNTRLSDGSIDNSGCDNVTDCCPGPELCPAGECPGGECCNGECCPGECFCASQVPGPGDVCVDDFDCSEPCVKDADCPTDFACIDDGACGFTHCHPLCGTVEEAERARRQAH